MPMRRNANLTTEERESNSALKHVIEALQEMLVEACSHLISSGFWESTRPSAQLATWWNDRNKRIKESAQAKLKAAGLTKEELEALGIRC